MCMGMNIHIINVHARMCITLFPLQIMLQWEEIMWYNANNVARPKQIMLDIFLKETCSYLH